MRILVTGGSKCGKSRFAEELALRLPPPRRYIATMEPLGEEALERIARHRSQRAGKGFETVECPRGLEKLRLQPSGGTALVECLGNLVANELFSPAPPPDAAAEALRGLRALEGQTEHLIVVTNEVGADGEEYPAGTMRWIEAMGRASAALAERFDSVVEVVCGIPVALKGGEHVGL